MIVLWWIGGLLIAVGLAFWCVNVVWWHRAKSNPRTPSPYMLMGGLCCALGMLAIPLLSYWFWVPLVIDPWGLPVSIIYALVLERNRKREERETEADGHPDMPT